MRERCSARVPTVDAGRSNSHSVRFPPMTGLTLLLAEAGGAWGTRDLHRAPSTSRTVRPGRASAALALPAPPVQEAPGTDGEASRGSPDKCQLAGSVLPGMSSPAGQQGSDRTLGREEPPRLASRAGTQPAPPMGSGARRGRGRGPARAEFPGPTSGGCVCWSSVARLLQVREPPLFLRRCVDRACARAGGLHLSGSWYC